MPVTHSLVSPRPPEPPLLTRYLSSLPEAGVRTRSCRRKDFSKETECEGTTSVTASFDQLSTSDYSSNLSTSGSLTRPSLDKFTTSPGSGFPTEHNHPSYSSTRQRMNNSWDTDSEGPYEPITAWEEAADADRFRADLLAEKCLVLTAGDSRLLLPQENLSNLPSSSFSISLPEPHLDLTPPKSLRLHHVGPIVQTCPPDLSGEQIFPSISPAYLILPVAVEPLDQSWLSCLYSDSLNPARWQPLPRDSFRYQDGYILLKTCCLHTLFTVVYREELPQIRKKIRSRIGGNMSISAGDQGALVKVTFPRGTCREDTDAFLRILYDCVPGSLEAESSLACPIIMLGPHGFKVGQGRKMVKIELPVPHYKTIMKRFPGAELLVYESSTRESEPPHWIRLELDRTSIHTMHRTGDCSISFSVHHFSFFKVVWGLLSGDLQSVKMGLNYFYPYISFPMNCKAYMEENPEDNSFGLEVICSSSDCDPKRMQSSNYRYEVGSNVKPKMVKPGKILVRLKSQKFEANTEAGEDTDMEKEEDFCGRDFEKQFTCIFKKNIKTNIDRGAFGKVVLDRVGENREKLENLFEINLNKTGIETEATPPENTDTWSIVAIKELAGNLDLMNEAKMRKFACYIGFTE